MSLKHALAVMIVAMLGMAGNSFAQVSTVNSPNTSQDTNLDRPLGSALPQTVWAPDDVQNLCKARFPGKEKSIRTCVDRNERKVGRVMSLGDQQEFQSRRLETTTTMAPPTIPIDPDAPTAESASTDTATSNAAASQTAQPQGAASKESPSAAAPTTTTTRTTPARP